ncbi:Ig-like domain-containing protein [Pantoea osteomyelitidis]|uniref:Ig-like domain-containing protein n=1 Tax=Pantoea osteomyelitidis TaxID=3230026 RepID=A0ABW7PYZ9_9GAMM
MANSDQLRNTRLARAESALGSFSTDSALNSTTLSAALLAAEPVMATQSETTSIPTSSSVSEAVQTTALTTVAADVTPPAALRIYEPVAGDGVIAAWEANNRVHVRGRAEDEPGATVTLTFGDQSWQSTVNQWGYWNASMPPETLQGLPDGNYSMTLTITDKAGNSTDTTVNFGLYVDKTISPTLTLDPIMDDNAVGYNEGMYGMQITGSSTHLPVGAKVTAIINGVSYQGVVDSDGHWSVSLSDTELSTIPDGIYSVQVSATDPNGKVGTTSADVTLITHWDSIPELHFDKVTSDNVVNALEMQQALTLTGSLSNVPPGQTLWINDGGGKDYQATILADGSWSLTIPAAEVVDFIHRGELHAWGVDGAGNYIDGEFEFNIITTLPPVYYELDIGGDMVLNYQEAHSDLSFYIEGVQSLTINDKTYEPVAGMVTLSSEDLLALPDGPVDAVVWQEDQYGNSASDTLENFFTVATHDLPTLTLNTPFDDSIIDSADVNNWHLIEGSSTHLEQGALVTLTLGDQSYSSTVKADGGWALTILAGQLAPLDDGDYTMTVTAQDSNGNIASATQSVTVAWHDVQSATTLAAATESDDRQISTLLATANDDDLNSWLTSLTGSGEITTASPVSEPVSESLLAQLKGDAENWQPITSQALESNAAAEVTTTLADLLHDQHGLQAIA